MSKIINRVRQREAERKQRAGRLAAEAELTAGWTLEAARQEHRHGICQGQAKGAGSGAGRNRSEAMNDELAISPRVELHHSAARNIIKQHDAIVFSLAKDHLPREDIQMPQQLRGRLEAFDYLPKMGLPGYREYVLDGRPIARFWEPEMEWEGLKMTITQKYQVLP